MRLATWNVNSVQARLPRLLSWLEETRPDVLCLQETKAPDAGFPAGEVGELGYEAALYGTGRWNGVAILSRAGLDDVRRGFPGEPGFPGPEARAISATCAGCRVWSVYVPNGRALDSPHLAYKLSWLAALRDALAAELSPDGGGPRLAVCGDFNIAPRDDDVWDPAAFIGSTHVTPEERAALAGLLDLGLTDVPARALKGSPSPTGTTGPACSTRAWACASTWSWPARAGCGGQGRLHRPGGPQGQGAVRPRPGRGGPGPARDRVTRRLLRVPAAHRLPAGATAYPRRSWLPLSGSAGTSACMTTRRCARRWPGTSRSCRCSAWTTGCCTGGTRPGRGPRSCWRA